MKKISGLIFLIFIMISATGCTTTIRGRVVDAETGEPVEGAVYAINWFRLHGCCMSIRIGDGSGEERLEVADGFTDADGYFEIPKYQPTLFAPPIFRLGVYKKGYAVWDDEDITRWNELDEYYAGKKGRERGYFFPRSWELKDGMVIRLDPWKDSYSRYTRYAHASSACSFAGITGVDSWLFKKVVMSECDFSSDKKNTKDYYNYLEKLGNDLKKTKNQGVSHEKNICSDFPDFYNVIRYRLHHNHPGQGG